MCILSAITVLFVVLCGTMRVSAQSTKTSLRSQIKMSVSEKSFGEMRVYESARYENEEWLRVPLQYGTKVYLQKQMELPLTVYAGTLSYSGLAASMKSPQLSSSSATAGTALHRTNLGIALPNSSSTKKTTSGAISFSPGPFKYECAILSDGTCLTSLSVPLFYRFHNTNKVIKADLSIAAGRFFLEQSQSTSWHSNNRIFMADWYDACVVEADIAAPHFNSVNRMGFHQNPFDSVRYWIRSENNIQMQQFLFNTSIFATDNYIQRRTAEDIICANSTRLHTLFQFRLNPQFSCRLKNTSKPKDAPLLKTGLAFTVCQKDTSARKIYNEHQYAASCQIYCVRSSVKQTCSYKKTENGNTELAASIYLSYLFFDRYKASFSTGLSFVPDTDSAEQTIKVSVYAKKPKITVSDTLQNGTSETSITFKHDAKFITCSIKLLVITPCCMR